MSPAMAWVVFRYEFKRNLTVLRLMISAAIMLFPPVLAALIQSQGGDLQDQANGAVTLFILIPEVVCLLGMLLWATPVIHAELEARTWAYLAVRPVSKGSILLGKYLVAVVWTMLLALTSLSLTIAVVRPEEGAMQLWGTLSLLTVLSCFAYGAIFILLGVLFLQRAMLAAVAYSIVFELLVALIPAVINQFTVQYHLRCLLIRWLEWPELTKSMKSITSTSPAWEHVLILLGIGLGSLTFAILSLRWRELVRADVN